jgi:hypothetical protein
MSDRLLPCPTCSRHIRVSESSCPFCATSVPARFENGRLPVAVPRRLSRAALFALGGLAIAPVACAGETEDDADSNASGGQGATGGSGGDGATAGSGGDGATAGSGGDTNVPVYGAPVATGGDTGAPVYGAPFNPAGGADPNGTGGEGGLGGSRNTR